MAKYKSGDIINFKYKTGLITIDEFFEVVEIKDDLYKLQNIFTGITEMALTKDVEECWGFYHLVKPVSIGNDLGQLNQQDKALNNLICECGASYTSNPNHHLTYCPLFRK